MINQMFPLYDIKGNDNLTGKILIASPNASLNEMFHQSLVYLISHDKKGAKGLIFNHLISDISLKSIEQIFRKQLDTKIKNSSFFPLYLGGPVSPDIGFVLHTKEYQKDTAFESTNHLTVSSNVEILYDIEKGSGPKKSLLIMGYTGWKAGQLEEELEENYWIIMEGNEDFIFTKNNESKWKSALNHLGIDHGLFAPFLGYC